MGVNGPVTYAGPAVQTGVPVAAAAVAAAPAYAAGPVGINTLGLYTVQPSFAAIQQLALAGPAYSALPAKAVHGHAKY